MRPAGHCQVRRRHPIRRLSGGFRYRRHGDVRDCSVVDQSARADSEAPRRTADWNFGAAEWRIFVT